MKRPSIGTALNIIQLVMLVIELFKKRKKDA